MPDRSPPAQAGPADYREAKKPTLMPPRARVSALATTELVLSWRYPQFKMPNPVIDQPMAFRLPGSEFLA
jgi:hypothetical protein